MSADDDDPIVTDEIDPRELARIRRRDHDAGAEGRELLRPGMGKVFKQVLDTQRKAAEEAEEAEKPKPRGRKRG